MPLKNFAIAFNLQKRHHRVSLVVKVTVDRSSSRCGKMRHALHEDTWSWTQEKLKLKFRRGSPRSAGEPCACREKFGPLPIFKIFSLDQIRADQEKKEVRKCRASIYRTSPLDAVEHFLVSHVITGIVVIEFVISKNRRLGAISTTLNGHLLETVAWSSSLSSTSSWKNVKTAASFCWCTRSAGGCRHGSSSEFNFGLMGLFPSSGWFVCCSPVWSWSCSAGPVCSSGSSHRSRGRLPCIIMEEQEAVVSLVLSSHNFKCIFQGGRRQSLGKSVVMRTLRNARSIAADDDGKTFAATFYHCHWTGSRICHAHRSPSAREWRSQWTDSD